MTPYDLDDSPPRPSAPDLAAFLLARIAEDEADANLCIHPYGKGVTSPTIFASHSEWPQGKDWYRHGWSSDEAPHLSRWSPARVLADVAAKRAIVEHVVEVMRYADSPILYALAAVYSDHPDFNEAWRA